MSKRIAILQYARSESNRVPHKLRLQINGKSLLGMGVEKLLVASSSYENVTPVFACPFNDLWVQSILRQYPGQLCWHTIPEHSGATEDWNTLIAPMIEHLQSVYDYIWLSNVLCRPFISIETCRAIIDNCIKSTDPFVTVSEKRGAIWNPNELTDPERTPILGAGELANTKLNPIYYEYAHLGYGLPVSMLTLPEKQLADHITPFVVNQSWRDKLDIDTQDDVEHMYSIIRHGS